jgi:hypothetical protein
MKLFKTLFPGCREASRLQSEELDQALPFFKRAGLALHLLVCSWCRRYGKQLQFIKGAVHDHADAVHQVEPQSLSNEARERMKRYLQERSE